MPLFRSTREPTDPLVADLTAALDADRVRADGAQRSLAAHDASVFDGGVAGPVCFPETTEEVQAIMRIAEQHGSAVVPRGAGTGLAGGAIPLGRPVVVSTGRMNKVLSVDTNNRIAWVQPGVINLDLSKKLQSTTHDANLTQLNVLKLQEAQAERGQQVEGKAEETRQLSSQVDAAREALLSAQQLEQVRQALPVPVRIVQGAADIVASVLGQLGESP